jgi:hypothetical protein
MTLNMQLAEQLRERVARVQTHVAKLETITGNPDQYDPQIVEVAANELPGRRQEVSSLTAQLNARLARETEV